MIKIFLLFGILGFQSFHYSATFANFETSICSGVTEIPESECAALIDIYNEANGDNRTHNDNRWNTGQICWDEDTEGWRYGVKCICDENTPWKTCSSDRVRQLALRENNLSWSLSASIAQLTGIILIDISKNNISSLPDVRDIFNPYSNLGWLSFNENNITILPDSLYRSRIALIGMRGNPIMVLSWAISNMQDLRFLSIWSTPFTIPPQLRNLWLIRLDISNKWLDELPEDIGNLYNLQFLDISRNNISSLPASFSWLTHLENLFAQQNQLTEIPGYITWFTQLESLDIASNAISGTLDFVCNLSQLKYLYAIDNNFFWPLPECLQDLTHRWEQLWYWQTVGSSNLWYNYLLIDDVDASFSGFLDQYISGWNLQYRPVDYAFSGTADFVLWSCDFDSQWTTTCTWHIRPGDLITLSLHYSNAGLAKWRDNLFQFPLLSWFVPISSSVPFTTGIIPKIYWMTGDSCFEEFRDNNAWAYRDVVKIYSQAAWSPDFLGFLINNMWYESGVSQRWISYLGDGSDAGKYFVDFMTFRANSTFRAALLDAGIDITTIPWCGTGEDRPVVLRDVSNIRNSNQETILLTWFLRPSFSGQFAGMLAIDSANSFVLEGNASDNTTTLAIDTQRNTVVIPALSNYFAEAFEVAGYTSNTTANMFPDLDQNVLVGTSAIDFLNDTVFHQSVLLANTWADIQVLFDSWTHIDWSGSTAECLPILTPAQEESPIVGQSGSLSGYTLRKTLSIGTQCSGDSIDFSQEVHIRTAIPFSGRNLHVKTSHDGITRNDDATTIYSTSWNIVEITTNHFSYFAISEENGEPELPPTTGTIPPSTWTTPPSGWSILTPDRCPNGDFSPSYYDGSCGTQSHGAAPTITRPRDRLITRKQFAQLISIAAENILALEPMIPSKDCVYSDIGKLTKSEQQSIKKSCMYGLMWLHKNGKDVKVKFEPNTIVTYNETATILSRLLYDGKYNPSRASSTKWYTPHVRQLQKIWLLTAGTRITQNLVIDILSQIQQQPELVQRPDAHQWHASASTGTK